MEHDQVLCPFKSCSSFLISAPSGSGKTEWVRKLLTQKGMFDEEPVQIMYCYGVHQQLFDTMEREIDNISFHEGIPTETDLKQFAHDRQFRVIVFDDLMRQCIDNPLVEKIYYAYAHHYRLCCIQITHNIFCQGKSARTIALNSNYIILMKNLRDVNQIMTLGRQLFPTKSKAFVQAYSDAVSIPYGYFVIDIHPHSEDPLRLRTNIFKGENPVIYTLH